MDLEIIHSRFKDMRANMSANFKILHSQLEQYEKLVSDELDLVLTAVISQANDKESTTAKSMELEQLQQTRGNVFSSTEMGGDIEKVLDGIKVTWNITEFENALNNLCVIQNSIKPEEKLSSLGPYTNCSEGHLPGDLHGPRGLSIDSLDNIYISDQYNKRIQIFCKNGEYQHHFGDEHLTGPWSVAISGDNAYVTDAGQHGVFWFKVSECRLVKKTGGKGTGKGQFNVPHGIDMSADGLIYICDCFNDRITVLDSQLGFVKQLCEWQVVRPDDITVRDRILILDSNDPCFHIFNLEGVKIQSIIHGLSDSETHMTKWGYFFAVNWDNNLVVISDAVNHCIRVFSLQGELVESIGQVGMERGEFMTPQGVGILKDKRIVTVCMDKKSHMLQVF